MIGNPKWFTRRRFGGWGYRPKTWQGWVSIAVFIVPVLVFNALPYWDERTRIIFTVSWLGILLIDSVHIMINLGKDEREYKIEAVSERNAAWAMVIVLVAGILYDVIRSAISQDFEVNIFLFAALLIGAFAKTASNIYLERKGV